MGQICVGRAQDGESRLLAGHVPAKPLFSSTSLVVTVLLFNLHTFHQPAKPWLQKVSPRAEKNNHKIKTLCWSGYLPKKPLSLLTDKNLHFFSFNFRIKKEKEALLSIPPNFRVLSFPSSI